MGKILISFAVVILCSLKALATEPQQFHDVTKDGYNFWLSSPASGETKAKKPLVIFLHGSSLCGHDLNRVMRYGTMSAVKKGLNLDAYVIAPQNTGGAWKPEKIMADVEWVEQHYPIDSDRIYVLGMSLGGYGTIDFAAAYPDRVAAAMAFCGGGTSKTLENLNQVPLWIVHGTSDHNVSIAKSDRVVSLMKAADPKTPRLHYDRVPGMNHSQPARFFYMPSTYRWLFQHSLKEENRPVAPKFTINQNVLSNAYGSMRSDRSLITVQPTIDAIGDLQHAPGTRNPIRVTN